VHRQRKDVAIHAYFSFSGQERSIINNKVDNIVKSGANVVVSMSAIDAQSLHLLGSKGIIALRHVREDSARRLAKGLAISITRNCFDQMEIAEAKDLLVRNMGGLMYTYVVLRDGASVMTLVVKGSTNTELRQIVSAARTGLCFTVHCCRHENHHHCHLCCCNPHRCLWC
jgi:chaperonin GroEL (HSP60 family)